MKINYNLLPVKAHYFFFMAAMGPVLPFLPVIGKQLGISEIIMGLLMSLIPILFTIAKPLFGFILDYFQSLRKIVFVGLVVTTTVFFVLLHLVSHQSLPAHKKIPCSTILNCKKHISSTVNLSCQLMTSEHTLLLQVLSNGSFCSVGGFTCLSNETADMFCAPWTKEEEFYSSSTFWSFVVLLSAASVGYNVANGVSDTICFDVLGSGNESKYGKQRVWGTVGFGLSALLGGYCVDWWSELSPVKDYSPAFLIAIIFTSIDLFWCYRLKLPVLQKSESIVRDLTNLVKDPSILLFLFYSAFLGICESLILFFLFWYLEDMAFVAGMTDHIKLLQGLTIAAETLIGEIVFFPLSGRILRKVGYRHCLSLCFLFYTLRLGLLSLINNPWWALAIELLQGPSYALSYATIVVYASAISPPGTSATMQGLAAGMDDGFGFCIGSLIGGVLYKSLGGSLTFRVFAYFALVCCITHCLFSVVVFRKTSTANSLQNQEKRSIYNPPEVAAELNEIAS